MATLTPEQQRLLQSQGRLYGNQLGGVVPDGGAYGGLKQAERFDSYGWKTSGDNEGTAYDKYDRAAMEWAAQQLGVNPNGMDDAQLYQALQAVNVIPGQYTLTQDAANQGDAQTRARQNFTLDASGNLVPAGDQQLLDLNPNSDWRAMGQPLATYLAGIGTLGAMSMAGVGAGTAAAPASATTNAAAGGAVSSGAAAQAAGTGLTESELAAMAAAGDAGGFPAASVGAETAATGAGMGSGANDFYQFQAGAGETAAANPGLWQQLQNATGLSGDALMRLGTSLGLGAVSAMGPNSQTTTTQNSLDPATAARQQASWDNAMNLAQQPFRGPAESQWQTDLSGLDQGLVGTYSAQNQQNQMLGDAQGLVKSGTAGGTSAQNGLLGDVKSYLERATAAGTATTNPYAGMDNPYTQKQIDFATADLNRAYANNVAPKFSAGSSFGSSGLAQAEVNARNDLLTQQAKLANDMRYKDLFAQQQLGESYAGRNDNLQNLIRQLQSQGAGTLGSLGESAASRADSMTNSNLNRDLTGAGLLGNLSQIPVNTANTIFNQWNARTNAADQNTNRAFNAWQMQYEDPFKRQAALQSATGTPTTTQTQTTPNGNAWSRGVGGAIAGAQMYNSLTGAQKKSSNLWGL